MMSRQSPDLPARFESLNDDTLSTILQFVGDKSYTTYAGINKQCKEIYATSGMTKKTFLFGYGSLASIIYRIKNAFPYGLLTGDCERDFKLRESAGEGVVCFNRLDILEWALHEGRMYPLSGICEGICNVAAEEGRLDILVEVWNNIEDDEDEIEHGFRSVDYHAARGGKLNVIKWVETKGFNINEYGCASYAAEGGQLHILKWLQEEKGLQLTEDLYDSAAQGGKLNILKWLETNGLGINPEKCGKVAAHHAQLQILEWLQEEKDLELDEVLYIEAIWGGHLHVMKWLKEQACPWGEDTFIEAAEKGKLAILQWLHDEGCPWPENDDCDVDERRLKPEVIDWCSVNGYSNRIIPLRR